MNAIDLLSAQRREGPAYVEIASALKVQTKSYPGWPLTIPSQPIPIDRRRAPEPTRTRRLSHHSQTSFSETESSAMAGTAPDTTTTFNLNGVGATDALLGTAPGKLLRVGPEHILSIKTSVGTGLHGGVTNGDTLIVWDRVAWLALHGIDVSELVAELANWLLQVAVCAHCCSNVTVVAFRFGNASWRSAYCLEALEEARLIDDTL